MTISLAPEARFGRGPGREITESVSRQVSRSVARSPDVITLNPTGRTARPGSPRRHAGPEQAVGGGVGEPGRAADVHVLAAAHERREVVDGQAAAAARVARRGRRGCRRRRLGPGSSSA